MIKKPLSVLTFGLLSISIINAQTTIPGGYVSGTWKASNSPYLIHGDITIYADSKLTIEPGVEVNFQGYYSLAVDGALEAVGTALDSIIFTAADTVTGWQGIRIGEGADSTRLDYCIIDHGFNTGMAFGGGIFCASASTVISHCLFSDNRAYRGGGIYVEIQYDSDPFSITDCIFTNNQAEQHGGGIWFRARELILTNCLFEDNQCGQDGGGLYCYGIFIRSVEITGCRFLNNTAQSEGGGVMIHRIQDGNGININDCEFKSNYSISNGGGLCLTEIYDVLITNCTFNGNTEDWGLGNASDGGGAIYIGTGISTISYCTFNNNLANNAAAIYSGGPILVESCTFSQNTAWTDCDGLILYSDAIIVNSIIIGISRPPIHFGLGTHSIKFCDILATKTTMLFQGAVPAGLGELTGVNTNGDSCDVFSNIYYDPEFIDALNGDYNLQYTSPCIDAGDPDSPSDPDGTITDIGRYFFNQDVPIIALSESIFDFGSVLIGQQADTILKLYNNGLDTLVIYQVLNDQVVFSTDYTPVDSLILPGNSIFITITFTPVNTSPVIDTLHIYNNDKNCIVKLIGTGQFSTGIFDLPEITTQEFLLGPAYPNPFSSVTSFEIDIPRQSFIILAIYNMFGEVVSTLISKEMEAGRSKYVWDAGNLTNGTYILRLQAGEFNKMRKIVLLK